MSGSSFEFNTILIAQERQDYLKFAQSLTSHLQSGLSSVERARLFVEKLQAVHLLYGIGSSSKEDEEMEQSISKLTSELQNVLRNLPSS